ncbi:MAG: heme ABC transporter permease CcmC [Acidimicrobiia bacterium]
MKARPLDVAAAGTLLFALGAGLLVPPDAVQGDLQRIMYVHVPSAWLAYLSFTVTLIGSVTYLVTRRMRWDHLAGAAAEVGVVFTGLALATGMIWGKPVWGVWWTWDARLVLTAVLFFVYLGYLALRRSIDEPEVRARRAAVLGIVAVLQIPVVHFSVTWWRGLHQPPTVLRPDNPQIDSPLLFALLMGVAAFTVVFAALVSRRKELAEIEDAALAADPGEEVAGSAVAAPRLEGGTA